MSTVVSNPNSSISNTKIGQDTMEKCSMSTIDNKYTRSTPIL